MPYINNVYGAAITYFLYIYNFIMTFFLTYSATELLLI